MDDLDLFDESEKKRGSSSGHSFRDMPKPDVSAVEEAVKAPKDKRRKRGRTIRFEPHDADLVMTAVDEWAAKLASEKGAEIGAKVAPFPSNDVYVWCIKRGLLALEEGERPHSVVSGSLIV